MLNKNCITPLALGECKLLILIAFTFTLFCADPEKEPPKTVAFRDPLRSVQADPVFLDISWSGRVLTDTSLSLNDRLIRACVAGNLDESKGLIARGADPSGSDRFGRSPLMYAVKFGHRSIVEYLCLQNVKDTCGCSSNHIGYSSAQWPFLDIKAGSAFLECAMLGDTAIATILLENGADINCHSCLKNNALFYAAQEGKTAMVDFLLKRSLDVNELNYLNETALSYAVRRNRRETVEHLLSNGEKIDPFTAAGALCAAIDSNNSSLVSLLLKSTMPCDTFFYRQVDYQYTPLIHAAKLGRIEIARLLIEHDAQINRVVNFLESALAAAAREGNLEMVRFLLEHGAQVDLPHQSTWDPLASAVRSGNGDIVKLLIEHGASISDLKDLMYKDKLFHTKADVFRVLLPCLVCSLKVDIQSDSFKTRVYQAYGSRHSSFSGNIENVCHMLDLGLDLDVEAMGITKLMADAACGRLEEMNKNMGPDNARNIFREIQINEEKKRFTALDFAIITGRLNVVKLLVENGAGVNPAPDQSYYRKKQPLDLALFTGNKEIVGYLILQGAQTRCKSIENRTAEDILNALKSSSFRLIEDLPLLLSLEICGYFDLFYQQSVNDDMTLTENDLQAAFFIAAAKGYPEIAHYLLNSYPHLKSVLFNVAEGSNVSFGEAAFSMAARFAHLSILKLMVREIVPPGGWMPFLRDALFYAELYGNRKEAMFVLQTAFGVTGDD